MSNTPIPYSNSARQHDTGPASACRRGRKNFTAVGAAEMRGSASPAPHVLNDLVVGERRAKGSRQTGRAA
jgi:hypothetical protein